jgi:hypothetical protein
MLTKRTNIHFSKIPEIGTIGYLVIGTTKFGDKLYYNGRKQKYRVIAFPLCDNCRPYSIGIHTTFFENLKTKIIVQLSGFYFIPCDLLN